MPVPQSWDDIFVNPAQNSPQGSEPIGTQADDYIRQAFAFCKQLHDGWIAANGSVKFTGNLDANTHLIKNLGAPVDNADAATKQYADTLISSNFPRGTVVMWWGNIANRPAGWLLCDGSNGTPDLRDRMPFGAGGSGATPLTYGGNSFPVIAASQMPAHSHAVNDPGHGHGVYDPGHSHGVSDPGHAHALQKNASAQAGSDNNGMPIGTDQPYYSTGRNPLPTYASGTGIGIYGSNTGIGIYGSGTGIWLSQAGGASAFDNRPAFAAIYFLMKA